MFIFPEKKETSASAFLLAFSHLYFKIGRCLFENQLTGVYFLMDCSPVIAFSR